MVKKLGLFLRGWWAGGYLLAVGSVLAAVALRPSEHRSEQPPGTLLGRHQYPIQSIAFAPDGQTLASGGGRPGTPGEIKLWDVTRRTERRHVTDPGGMVYSLAFAPDGQTLATAGLGRCVRLWDPGTGIERATVPVPLPMILSVLLAYSPDGQTLALGGWQHDVRLRDLATGAERVLGSGYGPLAFDPTGRRLASADFDPPGGGGSVAVVRVWDVATGTETVISRGQVAAVWSLCFAPDGQTLATGNMDGTVRLWDAATGEARAVLPGHADGANAVAFSPDGRLLASGGQDGVVKLWDARTRRERACLRGHTGAVTTVAFSPDGRRVASGSYDGTVRLWYVGADD